MNNLLSMTKEFRDLMMKAEAEERAKKSEQMRKEAQERKENAK